jgi:hypothetical protein
VRLALHSLPELGWKSGPPAQYRVKITPRIWGKLLGRPVPQWKGDELGMPGIGRKRTGNTVVRWKILPNFNGKGSELDWKCTRIGAEGGYRGQMEHLPNLAGINTEPRWK